MKPDFLIVGTPRSGTTLVQRLACELPGVRVPPETHFLSLFAPRLLARRRFPLFAADLRAELDCYARLPQLQGLDVPVEQVVACLGGRCDSLLELFGALVVALAGPAERHGEKTPDHVLWWRLLTDAAPERRVVAVVRDPRAVVASFRVAWDVREHDVLARRWLSDQRQVARAAATLGERCLVLRYEDVVAAPDRARATLASHLGLGAVRSTRPAADPLWLPWETWKVRASAAVDPARAEAWRETLTAREASAVAAIARPAMARFGYEPGSPGAHLLLAPARHAKRWRFARRRGRTLWRIRRAAARQATV